MVALHVNPLSVEYCSVLPAGHPLTGADMLPPETVHPAPQVLLTMSTSSGADERSGQSRLSFPIRSSS